MPRVPSPIPPSRTASTGFRTGWLLDSHVHIYPGYSLESFLTNALANLSAAARGLDVSPRAPGCLVLTEPQGCDRFGWLRSGNCINATDVWRIEPTAEDSSVMVTLHGSPRLVILAGRQIVTRERLEVLAIGCTAAIQDALPTHEALTFARRHAAAVVLPWGFGKWWFGRGRIVAELLESEPRDGLFVGDNGNRPRLYRTPRLLRAAATRGVRDLPGSDPLPLPFHVVRVGQSGAFLPCSPDLSEPTRQIRALLRDSATRPEPFRQPEPLLRSLGSQLLIRLRKPEKVVPMSTAQLASSGP